MRVKTNWTACSICRCRTRGTFDSLPLGWFTTIKRTQYYIFRPLEGSKNFHTKAQKKVFFHMIPFQFVSFQYSYILISIYSYILIFFFFAVSGQICSVTIFYLNWRLFLLHTPFRNRLLHFFDSIIIRFLGSSKNFHTKYILQSHRIPRNSKKRRTTRNTKRPEVFHFSSDV
jgi:hypothetical protein